MFKKIKEKLNIIKKLRQDNKKFKKLYEKQKKENEALLVDNQFPKAETVVKNVISRGIDWYDYNQLPIDGKLAYYQGAMSVLTNETLKNELNRFISDQIKFISYESDSHEKTMHVRSGIVALETLMDRLKTIPEPDRTITIDVDELSTGI